MSTNSVIFHRFAAGSGIGRLGSRLVAFSQKVYNWVGGFGDIKWFLDSFTGSRVANLKINNLVYVMPFWGKKFGKPRLEERNKFPLTDLEKGDSINTQ